MIWLNEGSLNLCLAVKFGPEAEILDPCINPQLIEEKVWKQELKYNLLSMLVKV